MDLYDNPFHVLHATPRDTRKRIYELADEQSLVGDQEACSKARADLTNPRKRLAAEMAWMPGVGPNRTVEAMKSLEGNIEDIDFASELPPLARANLYAAAISRLGSEISAKEMARWITELAYAYEEIDEENILTLVNEDRSLAGFPNIEDLSFIESELSARREHYRKCIKNALDVLPSMELVKAVTIAIEEATDIGELDAPILIDDMVDAYELEAQRFLEKERCNVEALIDSIQESVEGGASDNEIERMITSLEDVVRNWDFVAQPIQVSSKSRGLNHEISHELAGKIRELAVSLHNEHGLLEVSQRLTKLSLEVFAEVVEVVERAEEDAGALERISEQQMKAIEEIKQQAEEWRREISYETEIGAIFKDKLKISPDGVEWKGRRFPLDEITRVRWGGTRHYVNGIPTGTEYLIFVGSDRDSVAIRTKKQEVFSTFIERLWKAVGVRLLTDMLEKLRSGGRVRLGSAVMDDNGIEFERTKLFGASEKVYCHWNELVIWNGAGTFAIGKRGDKKVSVELSYQDDDNIHILEAGLRMFWKNANSRLSSLLQQG